MRSAHSIPLLAIESLHNVLGGYTPNRAKYQEDMQYFSQSLRKYTVWRMCANTLEVHI